MIINLFQNSKIGKVAVKANASTVVSHEFRDSHVATFAVFIALKPPMKQLYQVNYTVPSLNERSSFCWNS